jgi:peptidyl-prolyl cis-trans isomerase A (cyclophilin A)
MRQTIFTVTAMLCLGMGAAAAQDQTPTSGAAPAGSPSDSVGNVPPPPADTTPPPPPPRMPSGPGPIDPSIPDMTGPQLLISTSMGDITLQLDSVRAPKTVEHILTYVKTRHYDGTVFYRVVPGALIQMGSWDAKGQGRPDIIGIKRVPLEVKNGLSNVRGTVGLARGEEPDSGAADFFINVGDESPLDAVFGKVIGGLNVVDAIDKVKTGGIGPMEGQAPLVPILVSRVSIVPGTDNSPAPAPKAKPAEKKKK